jgi:hypothetical protein
MVQIGPTNWKPLNLLKVWSLGNCRAGKRRIGIIRDRQRQDTSLHVDNNWLRTRRELLRTSAIEAMALGFGISPATAKDPNATHNLLVFGEQAVFLSHLPMFHGPNADGTEFRSSHRYQVIVEAAFTPEQQDTHIRDRRANSGAPFYTIGPEPFVLSRLFIPEAAPQLTSFTAIPIGRTA